MLTTSVVSRKGDRLWQGIPTIERATNGRLWTAFFTGGPLEPHVDNRIVITSSADGGETWEQSHSIVDFPGPTRVFDPCLWHDPVGRLWLFYNRACLEPTDHSLWALTTEESGATAPSWAPARQIDLDLPFAFRLNKPTVLSSGEWVLPVTWAPKAPGQWFAGPSQLQGVAICADEGREWTFHGAVEAPEWALENMILQRTDGTLLMLIRTGSGILWASRSADAGRTWDDATPSRIVNPGVRFFIRRLSSGRVLLINTPDSRHRTGLRAYLSESDDGTGFGGGLVLDDRPNVSYPDAVEAPDGTIHTVHDCERQALGEIIYQSFTEADILRAAGSAAVPDPNGTAPTG